MRNASTDNNHKKIVEALRMVGATVIDTHTLKEAFDILVIYRGKTHICEIKNPEYLPKVYDRERLIKSLSSGEVKCMNRVERQNVPYNIITSVNEAYQMIGVKV